MDAPADMLPGDFIRDIHRRICQENRKTHDDLLEMIVADALSDAAMRAIYKKATEDFASKPITTYMFVVYFPLEEIVKKAKDMWEEAGRRFYLLDEKGEVIDFGDTSHFPVSGQDHPCSGGARNKARERWESFYKKHPILVAGHEKLQELFPGWKLSAPHMRWYEKSGYPYMSCYLECAL